MSETLLSVRGLNKRFGGLIATNDFSLDVHRGETHALIGPNGAGKTTLIAQLQGELSPTSGQIVLAGRDITREGAAQRARSGIARSFQISSVFPQFTVLANVALAVQAQEGHSYRFWRAAEKDERLLAPARRALNRIGLEQRADVVAADLSHGERRQLELAMAIVLKPSLLLLDEPMAGMGRQDSQHMTHILAGLKGHCTILLVEHDMNAVFALADRITVMVAGRAIKTAMPDAIRTDPEVRSVYLGRRN
jgi:branched-chain amino acid transport system ATP-binding protein